MGKRANSIAAMAFSNLDAWLRTPRTLMMVLTVFFVCFIETTKAFRSLTLGQNTLYLSESVFVLAYYGFNNLLSSMIFLVMISEIPRKIPFQNCLVFRGGKLKWLAAQVLYCLCAVAVFLLLLVIFSFFFSLFRADGHSGWSPLVRGDVPEGYPFISREMVENHSPFVATLLALLPYGAFLFTISVFLLASGLFNASKLGLLIVAGCIFLDYISVQNPLPFLPVQYATLQNLEMAEALPAVLLGYALFNAVLFLAMAMKVRHTDLTFGGQMI